MNDAATGFLYFRLEIRSRSNPIMPTRLKLPPHIIFHHDLNLMVYKPRGVLNIERIQKDIAAVTAAENQVATPFNRFVDLSGLSQIRLDPDWALRTAKLRRMDYADRPTIKSAYYVTTTKGAQLAKMCAAVTESSALQIQVFEDIPSAAKWLGVSEEDLTGIG